MGSLGPLARSLDDIELALSVLAPDAPPPRAVERVAVFEEDGLQPVSAACREAVRTAAAAFDSYEARPPGQAEARRLFDAIAGEEIGGLPAFVGDRDAELAPYNRGAVAFARTFEPSLERYLTAFDDLAALEDDAAAWFEHHPVDPVPGRAGRRAAGGRRRVAARRRRAAPARAASSRSARTPTCSGCRRSRCRSPRDPLPVGVQLIGWHGSERTLIALARRLV